MVYVILAAATILAVIWFILLGMVSEQDWVVAATNKVLDNRGQINKLRVKSASNRGLLAQYNGMSAEVMSVFLGGDGIKAIAKLEDRNEQLQRGNLKWVNIFAMPGYVLQRWFTSIGSGGIHKNILTKNFELYGKKNAEHKTKQLIAKLLSYPIIGIAASLIIAAIVIGAGNMNVGLAILGIGTLLILVLVYAMYDEVRDKVNKRHDAIARQFPNVVSKLALLVTSGMIVNKAWKETSFSQETELYQEMRRTTDELDNNVPPDAAYGNFITRCNTKETAKLASAILQNLSKGNAEIGRLLQSMAKEAWLERRHTAKRDSEKANSKLMIPTMLLFLAILAMLMVPVAMNFSSL
ncbi:MAG: type II secretion system F family protein [Oscillospiraceae bacterium]|jgi:tight adherence protein C|nr:type II secretion system F family protein [Oscillospiraceae bacterium]